MTSVVSVKRAGIISAVFASTQDFKAAKDAEEWCRLKGISVGRMQGRDPRGLLWGDFDIQKWRNLSPNERASVDGLMTGDMRKGPVRVEIKERVK